jgi:hypothetical protein
LGLEAAYIFGSIDNNVVNRRDDVQLATQHRTDSNVRGSKIKIGAHYAPNITDRIKLKLGVAGELEYELSEEGDETVFSLVNIDDGVLRPIDTLYSDEFRATINAPLKTTLSAGIGENNKWFIGAEYAFQNPLVFEGGVYDDIDFYRYESFSNISVGGFYLPKINSITSYFHRVTYRAGFHYQKSGLVVNDTEIDEYGISFGLSLPIGLKLSNVNLGFEMGKRGTTDNNLIEENFYNFRLSLSLNDKWFRKQKIF